ncbi:hypothetical protein LTR17_024743 [Elasticomyces elasticus]|nr:hypothetical protein LTR17_024743 [Elasticomyces elasticus]
MPGTMEPHRAHAVKIALQEIDRHLGVYDTAEKRRAMLSRLIQEHDLKDSPRSEQGKIIDMTETRYDHMLVKAMADNSRYFEQRGRFTTWKGGIQEVIKTGSKIVKGAFLQSIGFQMQETDDGPDANEDNVAPTESMADARAQEDAPKRETPQAPGRAPSPCTSTSSWKPNAAGNGDSDHEDGRTSPRKKQKTSKEVPNAVATSAAVPSAADPKPDDAPPQSPVRDKPNGNVTLKIGTPKSTTSSHPAQRANGLVKLGAQTIQHELAALWSSIQTVTLNMLGEESKRKAAWEMEPNDDLLKLYKRLYSEEWKGRIHAALKNGPVHRKHVLDACLAAAVFNFVLAKPPPWQGPKEMLRGLGEDVAIIDRVLQGSGCKRSLDHILWQAARTKLEFENGDEFRNGELRSIADGLAKTILIVLDDQLVKLGSVRTGCVKNVTALVSDALLLKGKLRAAPADYRLQWEESGSLLKPEHAEEIHAGQGKQEILWCVSPRVLTRENKDDQWSVVARSKVYTRPWPKGKQ